MVCDDVNSAELKGVAKALCPWPSYREVQMNWSLEVHVERLADVRASTCRGNNHCRRIATGLATVAVVVRLGDPVA